MLQPIGMTLCVLPLVATLSACGPVSTPDASQAPAPRVKPAGTEFRQASGRTFPWRGITAFRLAEQIASGREADAAAYLDWTAANDVTVVRVLAMAQHLFKLTPADGLRALPRLLELAAQRNIHVEIVALADTAGLNLDLDAHVEAVGKIAAAHPNAFLEIANEPFHPTQDPRLHDRATLARLAALVPDDVVVAYGSDAPGNSGGGDYVTVHMPRGQDAWDHVLALGAGRELVEKYGRPVVSDEPIGAAATFDAGRRDNAPDRFRAAAMLTRAAGMHATFHYEGGLQARIPEGIELACFKAWLEGLQSPPDRIERTRQCLAGASPRDKTIACLASAAR